jgi:hypothetical protein
MAGMTGVHIAEMGRFSDKIVGYANCTSLQLLTHLLTYYAMIAPTELTQNCNRLNTPYDPNQPIDNLFQQSQDARAFAVAGGQPYGDAMIVTVAFNTYFFPDACHTWQAWAIADKTWLKFKLDFAAARREFFLTNQNAHQSGFHSANMMIEQGRGDTMQETVDVIVQLAMATASDRGTVSTLTATNAKLASQLEAAQAHIKMLKDEIQALNAKTKPAWKGQRPAKSTTINTYCWSHGHQVHKDHTSATCKARKDGHQEMATKDNTMGRVAWGKEWCGGAANVIDLKLDQFSLTLECTRTMLTSTTDDTAILDSGRTRHFLSATAPCTSKQAAHIPLSVNMHNGTSIQSSHACALLLTDLPQQARKAHVSTKSRRSLQKGI